MLQHLQDSLLEQIRWCGLVVFRHSCCCAAGLKGHHHGCWQKLLLRPKQLQLQKLQRLAQLLLMGLGVPVLLLLLQLAVVLR